MVSMEIGIAAGIAVDVIFLLYNNARPKVNIEVISVS
jgi:MFS superfamily sulfate permease-like transporter